MHNLNAREREAISLLLAKPLTKTTASIPLKDLDARLRTSALGCGLAATLQELGRPLADRRAARDKAAAQRAGLWATAEAALTTTSLSVQIWAGRWREEIRRAGTVARQDPHTAATLLTQAIHTLATLCGGRPATDACGGPPAAGRQQTASFRCQHRPGSARAARSAVDLLRAYDLLIRRRVQHHRAPLACRDPLAPPPIAGVPPCVVLHLR
ncbi:TIGR02679 domain-containing protein [Streptomyces chiangmaiensis]|uniref:TIGR02679 domain-containing protein n=1 Tax=Streptomyces chiangmaiensis TaxID=766497 RepID=A0ABU7FVG8_9ACTN|nr:TIGR02679 domain-containing protein [Streptomyces chiangmaiensis]MED7827094.1 TIGR02679 domain-containing protein [Streptomyces chiangmaiensis]